MSQSDPVSNPFGDMPSNGPADLQNPFQIVGGGPAPQPSSTPSPFEAVGDQSPPSPFGVGATGAPSPEAQPSPAPAPAAANPFQVAPQGGEATQPPPAQAQPTAPGQPQAAGGFEMKGFPSGPAPMNQLETAPIGGGGDKPAENPASPISPAADPFAGMDLQQVSDGNQGATAAPPAAEVEEEAVEEDFAGNAPAAPPAEPEKKEEPAPEPAPEPAAKEKKSVPLKVPKAAVVTGETKQLALRAIFGVDHELSHQEIMQRARGLSGISNVVKVKERETKALDTLRNCASKLGLDDDENIAMSCPDGFIDFLTSGDTSLAILREGEYAAGVRETLLIIASELDKL